MKRLSRVVYLCDSAMEIVTRRLLEYPDGPLFKNSKGKPSTKSAVSCGFTRLQVRMGQVEMRRRGETISDDSVREFIKTLSPTKRCRNKEVAKTPAELRCEQDLP